jgi:hypothetical protein
MASETRQYVSTEFDTQPEYTEDVFQIGDELPRSTCTAAHHFVQIADSA